ncbi:MAG: NAD(P)H-dependent oxidoreductase [Bacteroidetes bacterium]|nr:NAD(P)H-dependent oxidoreductase [Bacteroidota bacterium]
MKKILILFAHPALEKSRVNKKLVSIAKKTEGITFRDLYEIYPRFDIDVKREQKLLLEHDIIIFHHPFYWYSCPPLLKQWIDLVLEHGWAYGSKGNALAGKAGLNIITAGGREIAYTKEGLNKHTVWEFLAPFRQSFALCKMVPLPSFVIYGTHRLDKEGIERSAADYRKVLEMLRDEKLDEAQLQKIQYLNDLLTPEAEA